MNLLTFDIEEWYVEKEYHGGRKEFYLKFDAILEEILGILAQNSIKATFFCVGKIATDFPYVIRKIVDEGHEIGCHSHIHRWLTDMTPETFKHDTTNAINALEDICGNKVVSYRAPAFSICESNKWAVEILAECGITNDSSIFPGVRDFGGYASFPSQVPCKIEYNGITLNEFPIPLYSIPIINKALAYSGGGYFRMLPLWFIKNHMKRSSYNMCYFHIGDLVSEPSKLKTRTEYEEYFNEPGTLAKRYIRFVKSNIGRGSAMKHLEIILKSFDFQSVRNVADSMEIPQTVVI